MWRIETLGGCHRVRLLSIGRKTSGSDYAHPGKEIKTCLNVTAPVTDVNKLLRFAGKGGAGAGASRNVRYNCISDFAHGATIPNTIAQFPVQFQLNMHSRTTIPCKISPADIQF